VKGKGLPDVENDLFAHYYLPKAKDIEALINVHIRPYLAPEKEEK
jgi:hypothetical protein